MARSPLTWLLAFLIGALIHIDWHLGRPYHDHLSFGFRYHWLLAVLTFAPLAWLILRRWPTTFVAASTFTILAGVILGQGVEPLSEVILFTRDWGPFSDPVRWRVFGEFTAAGLLTFALTGTLLWFHPGARRGLTRA
jgi:hypothetical protein